MKYFLPLFLIFTLFISSCSTTNWDRNVANVVNAPLSFDELFTIKSSTNKMADAPTYIFDARAAVAKASGFSSLFIEDPEMSSEDAFKIVPMIKDQYLQVNVHYSPQVIGDMDAIAELQKVMQQFTKNYPTKYSLFEFYYNADKGDFPTLQAMAKIRSNALYDAKKIYLNPKLFASLAERTAYWEDMNLQFEKTERVFNKSKKIQTEKRKAVMDVLDKVSEDKQFRNLVAKNDRKGAADLLRAYLPWEEMPPFEKLFWETHLKVMVDPLPLEERVLLYRGIDDDVIQVAQEEGRTLSKEAAVKEQKIFLMSTIMTKNQGTWNRRLRSLTAMYEKYIGTNMLDTSSEFTSVVRITNMFKKHSMDPKGSPFLSYTSKFSVSTQFGRNKNTMYFLDPRLIYFNMASDFQSEIEFLMPIASFPEDLAAVYDNSVHSKLSDVEGFLRKAAVERLDREYGKGKGADVFKKIEENSAKYFTPVKGAAGKIMPAAGPFTNIFKKTLGMPAAEVVKEIKMSPDMSCTDIVQLFWKN